MRYDKVRECIYNDILKTTQGKEYEYIVMNIKENQCNDCQKCGKQRCRLNIRDNKCINYSRRK